ncbi:hypothetical protein AB0K14_03205 [Actinosynnema sp. NPDC050801]|uniref:hypothetical protein n=1 Tax=unclassified Actinosynnema TaxID=2637065 RepID=UPI0033FC6BF6
MQSGQVPIWVPIVVGVIGLAGVIVGQLINARREDIRWKREREREDLRWQREVEKDQKARDHDFDKYWLDRKTDVYAELLQASSAWQKGAALASHHTAQGDWGHEGFLEADTSLNNAVTLVEIYGSEELVNLAGQLHALQVAWFFDLVKKEVMPVEKRRLMERQTTELHEKILNQIRKELRLQSTAVNEPAKHE